MLEERYKQYIDILKSELVPAMGCTEPIAIAYLGAVCRDLLDDEILKAEIEVSGNILKNVKSVIVPNTGKLKGIEAALAAGILFGDAKRDLEVIADLKDNSREAILSFLKTKEIILKHRPSTYPFDAVLTLFGRKHQATVQISGYHTNVVYASRDQKIIIEKGIQSLPPSEIAFNMSVEEIVEFADILKLEDIQDLIKRQIDYNMAIALEGLKNDYGANIGKVLLKGFGDSVYNRMKAYAAAASDARMNGCELPVVIISGSGNQGITASVPLIIYARDNNYDEEKLYRALVLSDLVTIHLKKGIGRLSAFCGATAAGVGQGAGLAYLNTGDFITIAHTIVNALGIVSGMVCDGAKASCAAKIEAAIDAGILGYEMYKCHQEFKGGDGLIAKGVENTIANISRLASEGMKKTDEEIIEMMIKC